MFCIRKVPTMQPPGHFLKKKKKNLKWSQGSLAKSPPRKPKDVGCKLFQVSTTSETGCRKVCSQHLLLFMVKLEPDDP